MITHLRIRNAALIDEAEVEFGGGLNVLTGETGAGKSIVVDAINFLLGERPARDFIRSGADSATVEGIVYIRGAAVAEAITALGVDLSGENELMIQRSLNTQGKSVCRVNGRSITVGMLKEISALLADVHGQHEHQSLLDVNRQLHLLDQFCGEDIAEAKRRLESLLQKYRENARRLKALSGIGNQRKSLMEVKQYQIDEIQKANLMPGEEDALLARRARLSGLEKLTSRTSQALALLTGGDTDDASVSDQIGRAVSLLEEIGQLDGTQAYLSETLSEAAALVSDAARDLNAYIGELDADPNELERIESRLDVIYRLKKKYGATVADVLAHLEKTTREMERLSGSEGEIKRLNGERRGIGKEITSLCDTMSALRKKQAEDIQRRIAAVLTELGMPNAKFEIAVTRKTSFGADGNDSVEFMISPNPGEPLKPLKRIASGGEMSRVMLALKTVLADADSIETLIFDEVDAGVSGRTAQQVAEKLAVVARGRQILCITHLPQIAAMADAHFLIEKNTDAGKTVTSVKYLAQNAIISELARLTGGAKITGQTLAAAAEMKAQAEQIKTGKLIAVPVTAAGFRK
ncbi:MAG: DNA repair protein RecN [Clostridiales bacterium]|jgi:DNA repair protein RecN (Recombination protein N)|nr:DNA repair protein RecN [Clostridiales bacterium]